MMPAVTGGILRVAQKPLIWIFFYRLLKNKNTIYDSQYPCIVF